MRQRLYTVLCRDQDAPTRCGGLRCQFAVLGMAPPVPWQRELNYHHSVQEDEQKRQGASLQARLLCLHVEVAATASHTHRDVRKTSIHRRLHLRKREDAENQSSVFRSVAPQERSLPKHTHRQVEGLDLGNERHPTGFGSVISTAYLSDLSDARLSAG